MTLAEFLPGIDVAVAVEPKAFLERMAVIAEQSGRFTVERRYDALGNGKLHVVNLRYRRGSPHRNVGGQLIARDDLPGRVAIEMRAELWNPDPPTRAVYRMTAAELMLPLLKIYNRNYRTRHRFRVREMSSRGPKPSSRTKVLFERFAVAANIASLHQLDWERFYAFVRESRQELPEPEIRGMLVGYGFPADKAERLVDIYVHLWNFKRRKW